MDKALQDIIDALTEDAKQQLAMRDALMAAIQFSIGNVDAPPQPPDWNRIRRTVRRRKRRRRDEGD